MSRRRQLQQDLAASDGINGSWFGPAEMAVALRFACVSADC
jgi:hypothetical protein